ncbi:P-loop containing nucleoside triphosphate hydrolase protein [Pilatotrama ljubarskyi]|nr:P-loop containing nucleoside triphosphate hydrolase protein [Pilatotrama ljubarskyi]
MPPSLPQLLVMLFSTTVVRDWIKLLLIGAVLETCRRLLNRSWESIWDFFWLTATFELDDEAADWVLYWLSQQKIFHTARSVEVTSTYYGLEQSTVDSLGECRGDDKITFIPAMDKRYSLWYKGRYMTVKRERRNDNGIRRPVELIELRILSRDPRVLRELLLEARKAYQEVSQNSISVFVAETSDHWKHVAMQEKRPISSVILDPGVLELVMDDAKDFLQSRKWYADRGIPFRRGYLLYGAPGAGKTSLIHSIAGELGLSVYILSLTVMGLDDNSLKSLIGLLPSRCIVLIEDIDAAFHRGMSRHIVDPEKQARQAAGVSDDDEDDGPQKSKMQDGHFNGVTLSGLLNALDGIAAQEGRILFATTNDYSALDPALLRPGRLDLHIEFQLASQYQARELFKRFYLVDREASSEAGESTVDEKRDSGYSSASSSPADSPSTTPLPLDVDHSSSHTPAAPTPTASLPESVHAVYVGMSHTANRLPALSKEQLTALADRFAEIIPPRAFSMATLQGYLMAYKIRPLDAVADAPAWVDKRMREKAAAASKSQKGQGGGAVAQAVAQPSE